MSQWPFSDAPPSRRRTPRGLAPAFCLRNGNHEQSLSMRSATDRLERRRGTKVERAGGPSLCQGPPCQRVDTNVGWILRGFFAGGAWPSGRESTAIALTLAPANVLAPPALGAVRPGATEGGRATDSSGPLARGCV